MYRSAMKSPAAKPKPQPSTSEDVSDIEKLLDEVETSFLTGLKPYNPNKIVVSSEEASKCECSKKTETNWEEVDQFLKEFKFEDTNPFCKSKNKSWVRPEPAPVPDKDSKIKEEKCYRVYLAGSYEVTGYSLPGSEKPCDNLRCLGCDHAVQCFDNYAWDPSTDYLFLRNNMPAHFEKVSKNLQLRRGMRAYACQCQHVSIGKITNVMALPQLRWVCGKHSVPVP